MNPAQIARLPVPLHDAYIASFTDALNVVFLVAAVVVLVAFALSWLIQEKPLRATVESSAGVGESFGAPVDTDSLSEITRGLARLVGRERTLRFVEGAAERAGIDLSPSAAYLLLHVNALDDVRAQPQVDAARFDAAIMELRERGYVADAGVTPAGGAVRDQLVAARTDCLRELIADWEPHRDPELDPLLHRLAQELGPPPREDVPAAGAAAGR